jgi:hypothetical protein
MHHILNNAPPRTVSVHDQQPKGLPYGEERHEKMCETKKLCLSQYPRTLPRHNLLATKQRLSTYLGLPGRATKATSTVSNLVSRVRETKLKKTLIQALFGALKDASFKCRERLIPPAEELYQLSINWS